MIGGQGDIIVAPATLSGGAIAVVRLSGEGCIDLVDTLFRSVRKGDSVKTQSDSEKSQKGDANAPQNTLASAKGYTLHYGYIVDGDDVVDDVMLSLFRAPHSYTSEDSVEISCHGSGYIVGRIIELALREGARMASEGEFTVRAFLAGRVDLSQAEAVSDMISATNRSMHRLATTQMRGGYSDKLMALRGDLVDLSALLELELDFSEEDVEFASRDNLRDLMLRLREEIDGLCDSFKVGNAIKEGVGVAIVGAPNAGKSTLLNRLLGEDRAMVSDVAGTTRDTIEDKVVLNGVTLGFIDTAGLHTTDDRLEQMGIERTRAAMSKADVIIQVVDAGELGSFEAIETAAEQRLIVVVNQVDLIGGVEVSEGLGCGEKNICAEVAKYADNRSLSAAIYISAKSGVGIDKLTEELLRGIDLELLYAGSSIVSNARHHDHLRHAAESLNRAISSLTNATPTDLLLEDLRHTLHHIGSITGEITTPEILSKIFSSFCIGK